MLEYIGDIDTNRFISLNLFNISLNFSKLNEEVLQNNVKKLCKNLSFFYY